MEPGGHSNDVDPRQRRTFVGRAFELADGTIILPCEFCGNPVWDPSNHTCEGLMEAWKAELLDSL